MIFYKQDKFGTKEGNCFASCLASILDMRPNDISFFMDTKDWYNEMST